MRSAARFTPRFPNSEAVLLVLLVNHVFFSSELSQCSQSAQTSDLLTIENAASHLRDQHFSFTGPGVHLSTTRRWFTSDRFANDSVALEKALKDIWSDVARLKQKHKGVRKDAARAWSITD